ncbi:serine/threonine-protein kinase [Streptomyces johnsoniae]|uniref:Serine/threonine-protein kinase n=1 Tax=Streptomyces johnsoniae TaxID=3075532 RepID=A0ABU2S580_9ACTN|nr:serine/threonine-protein kinase [Streptomyces sp. DSM 41886]MDT0442979.1 serine/threonine-protein kinase [Streptomyces sp. DSM 41886]
MTAHRTPSHSQPLGPADPREVAGYALQARLGSGGMGSVYLSYTRGGQPIALKVVRSELADDPEFRRRFEFEVRAARRVQGVYTVPVLDSNTEGSAPWLATAYVPGLSLSDAVRTYGPLPPETVLLLVGGVAEALQSIHAAGIIHRDLKPGNVLLASDGPKVIDFGIARAADVTALTGTDVRVGTPSYMAPEQITGASAGPPTDVFALGLVAHYAAGGTHPFGEGAAHAVMYRIVQEEPDLATAPEALRGLIAACLTKEAAARPTPAQVIDACRALAPGRTLRRQESWLPAPVADEVTQRLNAPPPAPAPTPAPTPPTPPAGPPTPVPVPMPARPPEPAGRSRPRGQIALAVVAVLAVITAGVLALQLAGGDEEGGAPQGDAAGGAAGEGEEPADEPADGDRPPQHTDPDAPYYVAKEDVSLPLRAPIFHEQHNVVGGECYEANVTQFDPEELTVQAVAYGDFEFRGLDSAIRYMFCDDDSVVNDGISFTPELFVGTIDIREPTAEQCYAAAHDAPLANPVPPDDILRGSSLTEGMGICVETATGTLTLLWIDRVEVNPTNRDLPTYVTTATQWKPNE